eukprot:5542842-Amphidinium_carterae.1
MYGNERRAIAPVLKRRTGNILYQGHRNALERILHRCSTTFITIIGSVKGVVLFCVASMVMVTHKICNAGALMLTFVLCCLWCFVTGLYQYWPYWGPVT